MLEQQAGKHRRDANEQHDDGSLDLQAPDEPRVQRLPLQRLDGGQLVERDFRILEHRRSAPEDRRIIRQRMGRGTEC